MSSNSFGKLFVLTTFGESHGVALGGIIDGCPSGLIMDADFVQSELDKRKPGQSKIVTQRKEGDKVEFLSGIFQGITTGTPIGFVIKNENQKSKDYSPIQDKFRPSHADYTYHEKYGNRDYRGGGRSSARETVCRVVGGAIAKLILKHYDVSVNAYVSQVGKIKYLQHHSEVDFSKIENTPVRCPDGFIAEAMINRIEQVRKAGDTIGGVVKCVVQNCPVGIGAPVFDKLHADLAKAMLSINAAKGFEYGSGFDGVELLGNQHNDEFYIKNNSVATKTNHSGGVQGGISNGEVIYFNVAFKPVATIMQKQNTINTSHQKVEITGKGRHDPCVLPRAVPIVEAMTALVLVDHILRNKTTKL